MSVEKKRKIPRAKKHRMKFLTIFAIAVLTIIASTASIGSSQALNDNNSIENNDNLEVIEQPLDNSTAETNITISLIDTSSGQIIFSENKIILKDLYLGVDNLDAYFSNLHFDENSISDIENSFANFSNQFSSDNQSGSGNPFSFSTTGHYLQLRNLDFSWQEIPNGDLEVGLSYENQKLMISEPIITTDTPLGYATLSFGVISQSADKFSVSGSTGGPENLDKITLDSAMENFNVDLAKPSLFFYTPILGTHSFTLTEGYVKVKGVSSFSEILEQRKINADINVSEQATNLHTLNPTETTISLSIIEIRDNSIGLRPPAPYDKLILKNANWHYDSIDQSLKNLDINFKDVSITSASLENSSVLMEELNMDLKNPQFSMEIPFLGLTTMETKQNDLDNLDLKVENLEVESLGMHSNILDNVHFEKVTARQKMPKIGNFRLIAKDIEGTPESPTIIQPKMSLTDPGLLGFELDLDKLDIEKPTESDITEASITINLPGSSSMTWTPKGVEPSSNQALMSSFFLLGLVILYGINGINRNSSPKYQ